MLSKSSRINRLSDDISFGLVAVIAFASAAVWWWVWYAYPMLTDDITYNYYHIRPNHGYLPDVMAELRWRYSTDNIRLGNMIYMFTAPLGRAFGASIAASSLLLTIILIWRLSGVCRQPMAMAFGVAAYILALPWYECMSVLDFAFNYVVGACVFTLFFFIFFSRSHSRVFSVSSIIVAIITGCWHEGFSVPLLCGGGIWLLVNIHHATSRQWLMWILLLPGIILLMTAPGMMNRTPQFPTLSVLISPFYYRKFFLTIAYFVMLGVAMFIPACRRKLDSSHLMIAVVCLTVIVIRTVQIDIARSAWAGETMAIIGILTLWSNLQTKRNMRYVSAIITVIISVIVGTHLIALCIQTSESVEDYKEIDKYYLNSSDGLVFYDQTLDYQMRPAALKRPDVDVHYNTWARWSYDILKTYGTKRLRVVPKILQDVDLHPGMKCDSNLYLKDGYMYAVGTAMSCASNPQLLTLTTDDYSWGVETDVVDFTTPAGGKYVYFKPRKAFRLLNGHPILGVKYNK